MILPLLLALLAPADTAGIAGGRLMIEPIGVSFQIPARWLDSTPDTPAARQCDQKGAGAGRLHLTRASLDSLQDAVDQGDRTNADILDSLFTRSAMAAHVGAEGWGKCSSHFNDLQVRVYVSDSSISALQAHISKIQPRSATRAFPITQTTSDLIKGWSTSLISWSASYSDYSYTARMEFLLKQVGNRTAVIVMMYTPNNQYSRTPDSLADRAVIVNSLRPD